MQYTQEINASQALEILKERFNLGIMLQGKYKICNNCQRGWGLESVYTDHPDEVEFMDFCPNDKE